MINKQKQAYLIGLINASKILTESEKSDWLGLLELMNDKQLGELEDILLNTKRSTGQPVQEASPQPPNPQSAIADNPEKKLSHISNLPAGLAPAGSSSAQKPLAPPGSDNYNTPSNLRSAFVQTGQRMAGAQNPSAGPADITKTANQTEQKQPTSQPQQAPIDSSAIAAQSPLPQTVLPSVNQAASQDQLEQQRENAQVPQKANTTPVADDRQTSKPLAVQQGENNTHASNVKDGNSLGGSAKTDELAREVELLSTPKTQAQIKDLQNIAELDYLTFRSYYFDSLLRSIQDMVMRLGYFAVIVALENSPAYRTYINTGKMLLGDSSQNQKEMFTKSEFEQFTDLLLNMRINVN